MLFFLACMPKKSPPTPLNKAEMQEVIEPPTVVLKLDNLEGVEVEGEMTLSMEATEEDLGEIGNLHRDFQKFLICLIGTPIAPRPPLTAQPACISLHHTLPPCEMW